MQRLIQLLVGLLLFCAILPNTLLAARVTGVSSSQQGESTDLVIRFNGQVGYQYFFLAKPERLVVDITGVSRRYAFPERFSAASPIKKIRGGFFRPKVYRIVIELNRAVSTQMNLLPFRANRHALTVHLTPKRAKVVGFDWPFKSAPNPPKATPPKAKKGSLMPVAVSAPSRQSNVIIIIDPGHGGKDPGATGRTGVHEKQVVLQIAKRLQARLAKQRGFKGILTRSTDRYLTLRQRLAFARRHHGDMFIAIHADAFQDPGASGASVFALSQRGATSEAARWLAEKENKSELMGGVELGDKSHILQSVLISLSQNSSVRVSLEIGVDIISALKKFARLHHHKVDQAAFVVLKSPDIPSLLVETGFLSNPQEERRLKTPSYQNKLAVAMQSGIVKYFVDHPPPQSWLAQQLQQTIRYRVRSGDSLNSIAARYHATIDAIATLNNLSTYRVSIGQTLLIPKT